MFRIPYPRVLPLFLALGAGSLAFAGCHHGHGHGGDPHKRADKISDKLKSKLALTSDQETKVRKLAHEVADKAGEMRAMHKSLHEEALDQLRSGTVDQDALNRGMEGREAKFKETRAFMVKKFAEFHAILNSEQREKLAVYLEKRGQKRRHHH